MSESEQYRAGFEAMAQQRGLSLMRTRDGNRYRFHVTGVAWETWVIAMRDAEAKNEASTEPSAIPDVLFDGSSVYDEIVRVKGHRDHYVVSDTLDAVVRLMRKAGAAGALTDDAKTRYSAYVAKCQQGRIIPCTFADFQAEHARLIREVVAEDAKAVIDAARKLVQCKGRYHTELNFKELAAAIEAHKAGSDHGQG